MLRIDYSLYNGIENTFQFNILKPVTFSYSYHVGNMYSV